MSTCAFRFTTYAFLLLCVASSMSAQQVDCSSLNLDARVVWELNRIESTKDVSKFVSDGLLPLTAAVPIALYTATVFSHNRYEAESAVFMLASNLTALGVAYTAKQLIGRERPWRANPACIKPGSVDEEKSFPSGHAAGSAAIATFISLRYPKWYVITPAVLYAGYTMYARMNLGMHHPTDVLAGAAIGVATAYVAHILLEKYSGKFDSLLPEVSIQDRRVTPLVAVSIKF